MKKILKNAWKKTGKNKKGFTLVEILVVLVIMAILAAVSIPSMVGFIDQAQGKAYLAEARTVYVAGQAAVSEAAGQGYTIAATYDESDVSGKTDEVATSMNTMLEGSISASATYTVTTDQKTKVSKVEYTEPAGKFTITIENGTSTIEKN